MDLALENAFRQPAPTKASLVRIEFKTGVMRLTDGGFALHNGELYQSVQSPFGVLDGIGQITEGGSGATTRVEISLKPESDLAVADMTNPLNQGALVQWWEGVIDPATGGLIGSPLLKFQGAYDKGRFSVDDQGWTLTIECGTEAELQLVQNSDWLLNNSTHQRAWPGELGLRHVTNLPKQIYWRTEAPRGAISYPTGSGTGTGGAGSGDSRNNQSFY